MKTIIVYMTRFGSTKEYAGILAKELKCKAIEASKISELDNYDKIIAMSGVYGGQVPIIKFVNNNWKKIKNKELTIIAVGLVPQEHWWSKITYFFIPRKTKQTATYYKILGRDPDSKKPVNKENIKEIIKKLQ